jgi:hypothetical protein
MIRLLKIIWKLIFWNYVDYYPEIWQLMDYWEYKLGKDIRREFNAKRYWFAKFNGPNFCALMNAMAKNGLAEYTIINFGDQQWCAYRQGNI